MQKNEFEPLLFLYYTQNPTPNELNLSVRPETIKILKEIIRENLLNSDCFGCDFFFFLIHKKCRQQKQK